MTKPVYETLLLSVRESIIGRPFNWTVIAYETLPMSMCCVAAANPAKIKVSL